jgi:hypothetical protein
MARKPSVKSEWDHTPITRDMMACANCLYYVEGREENGRGECMRYPPRPPNVAEIMIAEAISLFAWLKHEDEWPSGNDKKANDVQTEITEAYSGIIPPQVSNYEFCGEFRNKWKKPIMKVFKKS